MEKVNYTFGFVKKLSKQILTKSKSASIFVLGAAVLTLATAGNSYAQADPSNFAGTTTAANTGGGAAGGTVQVGEIKDGRIYCVMLRLINLIEGNGGALIMVGAGIATVISAAFGAFKAATSMFAVAASAFVLRSLVLIFFSVTNTGHPDAINCAPGAGFANVAAAANSVAGF